MGTSKTNTVYIDLVYIDELLYNKETTGTAIARAARLSDRTWERIRKEGKTNFQNVCAIAYALKVDPMQLIIKE